MDQTVEINEDLAEKLTPSKDDAGIDTMERVKILEAIAEVCMHQGEYHLATKKFTQAGNKIKVGILGWYIWGKHINQQNIRSQQMSYLWNFFLCLPFVVWHYKQCMEAACKYRFKNQKNCMILRIEIIQWRELDLQH